jgi:hypothetical protein
MKENNEKDKQIARKKKRQEKNGRDKGIAKDKKRQEKRKAKEQACLAHIFVLV